MESDRISRLLGEQEFRSGGYASLMDGHGKIVARSADHGRYIGQQVRDWVTEGTSKGRSGILRGPNLSGERITTALQHVAKAPGWVVAVAEPHPLTARACGARSPRSPSAASSPSSSPSFSPSRSAGASSGRWTG